MTIDIVIGIAAKSRQFRISSLAKSDAIGMIVLREALLSFAKASTGVEIVSTSMQAFAFREEASDEPLSPRYQGQF